MRTESHPRESSGHKGVRSSEKRSDFRFYLKLSESSGHIEIHYRSFTTQKSIPPFHLIPAYTRRSCSGPWIVSHAGLRSAERRDAILVEEDIRSYIMKALALFSSIKGTTCDLRRHLNIGTVLQSSGGHRDCGESWLLRFQTRGLDMS